MTDALGRRRSFILANVAVALSWGLMFLAPAPDTDARTKLNSPALWPQLTTPTVLMLLGGRSLQAIGVSVQIIAGSVWLSECCPSDLRGTLMTCTSFGWAGGTLMIYALGAAL